MTNSIQTEITTDFKRNIIKIAKLRENFATLQSAYKLLKMSNFDCAESVATEMAKHESQIESLKEWFLDNFDMSV